MYVLTSIRGNVTIKGDMKQSGENICGITLRIFILSHSGEMPVSFNWHLHSPIPADLLPDANKTIAM
jgi:hypothetical protein